VTGRVILAPDSTQAQGLGGRPLAMYAWLRLPDRSRLRLLNSPTVSRRTRQTAATRCPASTSAATSVRTSPLFSLAWKTERRMRAACRELEKWKNDRA